MKKKNLAAWMRSLVDIRLGEGRRTFLLFIYYLLVLFAYYILKPVSKALFLNNFDADKLPWLYILMALLGGTGASWMSRAAMKERLTSVIGKSQLFLLSNILLIWWLLQYNSGIVLYIFAVWVGTFSVITVGQFWLLTNNLFDSRNARRLIPLIGLAAVLGGILGGVVTGALVHAIGARHLVLVCGLLVGVAWFVVRRLRGDEGARRTRPEAENEYRVRDTLGLVWQSAHLRWISLIVGVMFVVDTLVDYQFSVIAKQTYQGAQLTAFLAHFQGIYVNVLSFLFQLLLAGPVLRHLGVGGALAFAPVGIAAGAAGLLAYPSLLAAASMRATEAASRYTFTRTGMELLYLPISPALKNRTKVFLEVFVDRVSRAAAGGLLLVCTVALTMSLREITLLTLGFLILWICGIAFVFRSYVGTLKQSLEKREVQLDTVTISRWDTSTLAVVSRSLDSPNERQVAYALHLLEGIPHPPIAGRLPRLLRHGSLEVRAGAYRLLAAQRNPVAIAEALEAAHESELPVRAEALHYLCQCAPDPSKKLEEFLNTADLGTRTAAVASTEIHPHPLPLNAITNEWIEALLSSSGAEAERAKELAAAALALANPKTVPVGEHFQRLLGDANPVVARAAIRAAGKVQAEEVVPLLIESLARRHTRVEAREALIRFGPSIMPALAAHLDDANGDTALQQQIPRVLAVLDGPVAAALLLRRLPGSNIPMRFQILKALNRIRRDAPTLEIPGEMIDGEIVREAKQYYQLLLSIQSDTGNESDGRRLLVRSLEERLDQTLERIFRLLGLRYPQENIYDTYRAVRSSESQRRAAAVEFLDHLLDPPLKRLVLPIVEEHSSERLVPLGGELFGLELLTPAECLQQLARSDDRWLKIVSMYRAAELQIHSLEEDLRAAESSSDPFVAETASQALSRMQQHVS